MQIRTSQMKKTPGVRSGRVPNTLLVSSEHITLVPTSISVWVTSQESSPQSTCGELLLGLHYIVTVR